mmetsp:Transcript_16752/g.27273  ORF Transcript_16752/g.27273 Transcript_16752/m.27273 type:complete len:436 (-) Transcript_16752:219-1526(-)
MQLDTYPIPAIADIIITHESRGTMDQDQGLTPSSSSLSYGPSSSSDSSEDDAPHLNRRNRRYALIFTLLMFFVATAAIFFAGGNKERADSTLIVQVPAGLEIGGNEAASTTAPSVTQSTPKPSNSPVISYTPALAENVTSSAQQPTEQHIHTESPAPTMQQTHPSNHHSPRHTDSPTHKHHHSHPIEHRPTYKPTGKPTHKRHTHSDTIMSPTSTESPTHLKQGTLSPTQHPSMHTESPSAPPSSQVNNTSVSVSASDSDPILRVLKPSALATIEKSNPDFKLGGMEQLSVEGDERISFIHFNLTSISDDVVARATLNLHLTTRDNDITDITVRVDMLPHVWAWSAGSVSWNEPLASEEPFTVGYLSPVGYLAAAPLASDITEHLYEVDVTSAISRAHRQWVTFRLSTESSGRLWFASEEWNGGELVPELVIVLL